MTMMLTELEARSLAKAIEAMRPDWQYAGIVHALGTARLKAHKWAVASAAINAASDEGNRTPAVIALEGRHWPVANAPHTPPPLEVPVLTDDEREKAHAAYLLACEAKAAAPKPPKVAKTRHPRPTGDSE